MKNLNIMRGIIASKLFRKPFYIHFYTTRRCNLRCGMCNVWKNKDSKEMSLEDIKITAPKIKELGATHIIITGGEPLLRGDIDQIVTIFSQLGFSTRLQTNATLLTEEKLDKLIAAGLDDITISLDTLDDGKQDEICGVKFLNVSSKALTMLRLAVKKMPKSMTAANIVLSHKNLDEIVDLIKFLDSIGVWSSFVPVNLSDSRKDYLFKAKADDFSFNKEDKIKAEKIYQEILDLKENGYKTLLSSQFLKQSLKYIKTGNKKWHCDAGELYFSIFPTGQFSPCDEILTDLNILDKKFMQLYKSKKFKEYLRSLQKNCEGCFYGCWRETSNLINSPSVFFDRFLTLIRVKKKGMFT